MIGRTSIRLKSFQLKSLLHANGRRSVLSRKDLGLSLAILNQGTVLFLLVLVQEDECWLGRIENQSRGSDKL